VYTAHHWFWRIFFWIFLWIWRLCTAVADSACKICCRVANVFFWFCFSWQLLMLIFVSVYLCYPQLWEVFPNQIYYYIIIIILNPVKSSLFHYDYLLYGSHIHSPLNSKILGNGPVQIVKYSSATAAADSLIFSSWWQRYSRETNLLWLYCEDHHERNGSSVSSMDEITIKPPNPKCRLYLCTRWTSEKVIGALVHKRGRKYQHDCLYIHSINSIKTRTDKIWSWWLYSYMVHGTEWGIANTKP